MVTDKPEKICRGGKMSKALETYLEAIYVLSLEKNYVRITDISVYLDISKPSVNRAVNTLKVSGFVIHEPYGDIELTDRGREAAEKIYNNHYAVKAFFTKVLNMPSEDAEREALSVGNSLSSGTVKRMVQYMNMSAEQ